MKMFFSNILFAIIVLNTNAQSPLKLFIDSIANEYLKNNNDLALIIGINNRGNEQIFYYGETEKGNKIHPDSSSIFEIGQISQVFTSILYADMVIKGELNADDQIQKYLPVTITSPMYEKIICKPVPKENPFQKNADDYSKIEYTQYVCHPDPDIKPQPILLCYLSTHTSGLPDLPTNIKKNKNNPYSNYSKNNLYDFLQKYILSTPIGYDFHYSLLGTSLLGHILELKTKKDYKDLVLGNICSKLNMNNTSIPLNFDNINILKGHNKKGKIAEHWTFDALAPSGALNSNITDMMKFLYANISTDKYPLKDVLEYTHNPRILIQNKKYGSASVALGWMVSPLNIENLNYVWQSGLTGGFASFIGFVETSRSGVVILSNTSAPVEILGKNIIQKLN